MTSWLPPLRDPGLDEPHFRGQRLNQGRRRERLFVALSRRQKTTRAGRLQAEGVQRGQRQQLRKRRCGLHQRPRLGWPLRRVS